MSIFSMLRKSTDDERYEGKRKVYARIPSTWFQRLAMRTVCTGETPKHVAFIMDGNRRYARKNGFADVTDGHRKGEEAMQLMVERCFDLGVKNVTVYAFSLENFKRSKHELEGLFGLLSDTIDDYDGTTEEQRKRRFFGIRAFGDVSRFPSFLREKVAKHWMQQKPDDNLVYSQWLNVCLGYTSRAEITDSIKCIQWGVRKRFIRPEDINESLLESCFWSASLPPVDLLIRTSGEIRLSDFLTWQAGFCPLVFTKTLWPDMTCWSLLKAFIVYQRNVEKTERERQLHLKRKEQEEELYFRNLAMTLNEEPTSYQEERKARVDWFRKNLAEKRHEELREFFSSDATTTQLQAEKEILKDFTNIYNGLQSLDSKKSYEEVKCFFLEATEAGELLKERINKLIDYNVTGMLALNSKLLANGYKSLLVKATQQELYQGEIIAWLVAITGVAIQISDDICDKSSVRDGKPCWYLLPEVGKTAVLDTNFIFSSIPLAVHHFFGHHPCYQEIALQFNKIITGTTIGQYLDVENNYKPGSLDIDIEKLTWERYRQVAALKANCQPLVSLALFLVEETNEVLHREFLKFGDRASFLVQVSNDYLDVFPPPGTSMGTDIQDGKLTWCISRALEKASPEQKKVLEQNYGKRDKQSVKTVKKIFRKLNLKKDFDEYQLILEKEKEVMDSLLSKTKGNRIFGDSGIPLSVFENCNSAFKLWKNNSVYIESGFKHT